MAWRLTDNLDAFLAAAGNHLRTDPVLHTVPLTVLATLQHAGPTAFGDSPPLFGWHESADGGTDGVFFQTPPFPIMIASMPPASAESLLDVLAAICPAPITVNVASSDQDPVLAAWAARTGGPATARMRSRLFKLEVLTAPEPMPPGTARVADSGDRDLLVDWNAAFSRETGAGYPEHAARRVDDVLSHHGFMLWETGGEPVALAGMTREVVGVVRVMAVYTPPGHRQRGYAGAVTTAVSQAALAAGAAAVVLFTDLANPTSNALYQRLGYRPIADRVVLDLTTGERDGRDVTSEPVAPSETDVSRP